MICTFYDNEGRFGGDVSKNALAIVTECDEIVFVGMRSNGE